MSQRSTYLNRLHAELMAAGRRLHQQQQRSAGGQASDTAIRTTRLGRLLGTQGGTAAHGSQGAGQRSHRWRAALAIGAASGIAAAAALVLTMTGEPSGTQAAYAGWTATPTAPATGQTAAAEAACRGQIAKSDEMERNARGTPERGAQPIGSNPHEAQVVQTPNIAPDEWQTVLSDTRGPYTMLIFEADEGHAKESCLTKSGAVVYGSGSYEPHPTATPAGEISVYYDGVVGGDPEEGRPDPYAYIDGQVGSGVRGVSIDLADGSHVEATVMGGWFLAWWPGTQKALSAEVTTTHGISTQPLAQ